MLTYPEIDPVMLHLGPIQIRWYGMMYLTGFAAGFLLLRREIRQQRLPWTEDQLGGLTTALILGVILGGRLGYVLFYDAAAYLAEPWRILAIWQGGMSFHGGALGALAAAAIFARREGLAVLALVDGFAPVAPIGIGLGRLANFINNELVGRVTDVPWAMVFPGYGLLPRHPSQLYEAVLEGLVLFALLWWARTRFRAPGAMTGLFALGYAVFRTGVEQFRQPDTHIGFLPGGTTMGQWLSVAMGLIGIVLLIRAWRITRSSGP